MITVIFTVGVLVYLVSMWWTAEKVAEAISNSTQTLEDGCNSQDVLVRILVVRNGRAAHLKSDCPFLLGALAIQTLSWCSYRNPTDAFQKRD